MPLRPRNVNQPKTLITASVLKMIYALYKNKTMHISIKLTSIFTFEKFAPKEKPRRSLGFLFM